MAEGGMIEGEIRLPIGVATEAIRITLATHGVGLC